MTTRQGAGGKLLKDKRKDPPDSIPEDYQYLLLGIESLQDYAIFMLDPEGYITTWNEGAKRIKGYEKNEIIGRHFSVFYPEEAIRIRHPDYELKVSTEIGRFEEEGWRIRKDGSRFWASVTITALRNAQGNLVGFGKVTRDLTERKQIEDKLKQSKLEAESERESSRLLVEGVKDYAIIMLGPDGVIKSWNTGAERIKGYKAEEIIGRHFSVFYPKEDVEAGKCDFELKYAEMEGSFEDESWRIRKDGSKFWANVILTALRDDNGTLIGYSKITRDVTQRKETEIALLGSEKRYRMMADKVIERSRQFEEVNKQLGALNQELETFSYSVSHDLRAPLRSIDGFGQLLMDTKTAQLDEEGKEYLTRIRQGTHKMAQLIDALLSLSRLNKVALRKKEVDLSQLAREILSELQNQAPDRYAKVRIQEGMIVQGDEDLLRSVLQNLLENAWKFTGQQDLAEIEFGRVQQGERLVYFVRDNGAGFDMAYTDMLFGVFQRLHDVEEFPGTGIGLATVRRIIHRHGGDIWGEGEVGKGAVFYFTLP